MLEMRTIVPLTATRRPNCEERRLPSDVTRCVSSIRARTAGKLGASTTVQLLSPSWDCAVDSCQGFGSVYSVQCRGSGMFIPDPRSEFFPSRIRNKEFKYFNPKSCFLALGNMIRAVHPGSRSRILIFYPSRIPDPGSRIQKGTGSRSRIRNTAFTQC
jgi:hypothetical protein